MSIHSLQHLRTKPRPALRLVGTKQLPREDWLNVRKQGIGSSDAAAAVGLNPYKSQLELWMEKTGRDTLLPKLDPQDEENPRVLGQHPGADCRIPLHPAQRSSGPPGQCGSAAS